VSYFTHQRFTFHIHTNKQTQLIMLTKHQEQTSLLLVMSVIWYLVFIILSFNIDYFILFYYASVVYLLVSELVLSLTLGLISVGTRSWGLSFNILGLLDFWSEIEDNYINLYWKNCTVYLPNNRILFVISKKMYKMWCYYLLMYH